MTVEKTLENSAINAIRFLSADGVEEANSGHPGLPMGTAAMAYTIWTKHLKHNPNNPDWFDRDRFILSGGHGSMLIYSLLYLTGYGLTIEDLKNFRQLGSKTPGHPEYGITAGVETTTGPLGQGFATGIGMAIAEAHLAAKYNKPGFKVVNHYTYAIVTDGDLMEGVTAEAASLAGHLKLGKLIYLYDDNRISIDGSTDLAFTEDRGKRFEAYGWQVLYVKDGNDVDEIDAAIKKAKEDDRPSLIICRTHIGYGMPTRQDTPAAHGKPPGEAELNGAKEKLGWPLEPRFYVPDDVLAFYRLAGEAGETAESAWKKLFADFAKEFKDDAAELDRRIKGDLPVNWEESLPIFAADPKGMGSRVASGKVINAIAPVLPELIGGSADLTPSNNTWIDGESGFQSDNRGGRYIHYGVREHAMGSALNGLALHKGVIPYGSSFLVFTDYVRPAIRLSALMGAPVKWIFTHDSIGVGEDGPTHQPVEHVASLRMIPNLVDFRPADANEVAEAWRYAVKSNDKPVLLALSRQNLPTLDRKVFNSALSTEKGAYVLRDYAEGQPELILMASGSEVSLIVDAAEKLAEAGHSVRVVSFPSWYLFKQQDAAYQESVLPSAVTKRLSVEAGVTMGWERWVGADGVTLGIDTFGESGKGADVYAHFGLTVENIYKKAVELLD